MLATEYKQSRLDCNCNNLFVGAASEPENKTLRLEMQDTESHTEVHTAATNPIYCGYFYSKSV